MDSTSPIILFGSGHLELQVGRKLRARGHTVVEIAGDAIRGGHASAQQESMVEFTRRQLADAGIDDDLKNLEIGLNARSLRSDLRLILRIFDPEIAEQMRARLDIHFAFSTSAVAAEEFVGLLAAGPAK